MMIHSSCECSANRISPNREMRPRSPDAGSLMTAVQQLGTITSWILTGSVLVLMPKCPACLAAYFAFGTGLGLSLSTAGYVRLGLMSVCIASLALLTNRLVRQRRKQQD